MMMMMMMTPTKTVMSIIFQLLTNFCVWEEQKHLCCAQGRRSPPLKHPQILELPTSPCVNVDSCGGTRLESCQHVARGVNSDLRTYNSHEFPWFSPHVPLGNPWCKNDSATGFLLKGSEGSRGLINSVVTHTDLFGPMISFGKNATRAFLGGRVLLWKDIPLKLVGLFWTFSGSEISRIDYWQ